MVLVSHYRAEKDAVDNDIGYSEKDPLYSLRD